jgi:hypothetical protein
MVYNIIEKNYYNFGNNSKICYNEIATLLNVRLIKKRNFFFYWSGGPTGQ